MASTENETHKIISLLKQYTDANSAPPKPAPAKLIDTRKFDVHTHFKELLDTSSLEILLNYNNKLSDEIRSLDSDMKMLVYENYNKFISASDTIQHIKTNFEVLEKDGGQLRSHMGSIKEISDRLHETVDVRSAKIEELASIKQLLTSLHSLFQLPNRMKLEMKNKNYEKGIAMYKHCNTFLSKYQDYIPEGIYENATKQYETIKMELRSIIHKNDIFDEEPTDTADSFEKNIETFISDLYQSCKALLLTDDPVSSSVDIYLKGGRNCFKTAIRIYFEKICPIHLPDMFENVSTLILTKFGTYLSNGSNLQDLNSEFKTQSLSPLLDEVLEDLVNNIYPCFEKSFTIKHFIKGVQLLWVYIEHITRTPSLNNIIWKPNKYWESIEKLTISAIKQHFLQNYQTQLNLLTNLRRSCLQESNIFEETAPELIKHGENSFFINMCASFTDCLALFNQDNIFPTYLQFKAYNRILNQLINLTYGHLDLYYSFIQKQLDEDDYTNHLIVKSMIIKFSTENYTFDRHNHNPIYYKSYSTSSPTPSHFNSHTPLSYTPNNDDHSNSHIPKTRIYTKDNTNSFIQDEYQNTNNQDDDNNRHTHQQDDTHTHQQDDTHTHQQDEEIDNLNKNRYTHRSNEHIDLDKQYKHNIDEDSFLLILYRISKYLQLKGINDMYTFVFEQINSLKVHISKQQVQQQPQQHLMIPTEIPKEEVDEHIQRTILHTHKLLSMYIINLGNKLSNIWGTHILNNLSIPNQNPKVTTHSPFMCDFLTSILSISRYLTLILDETDTHKHMNFTRQSILSLFRNDIFTQKYTNRNSITNKTIENTHNILDNYQNLTQIMDKSSITHNNHYTHTHNNEQKHQTTHTNNQQNTYNHQQQPHTHHQQQQSHTHQQHTHTKEYDIQNHLDRLFARRLSIFTETALNKQSIIFTLISNIIKSILEYIRLSTFDVYSLHQIQIDISIFSSIIPHILHMEHHTHLYSLLDETVLSLIDRCIDDNVCVLEYHTVCNIIESSDAYHLLQHF